MLSVLTVRMKKAVMAVSVISLLFLVGFTLQRRAIETSGDNGWRLKLPATPFGIGGSPCTLLAAHQGHMEQVAEIFYQFWETPALLVEYQERPGVVLLLYQYDTHWSLLTFDATKRSSDRPVDFPLDRIVRSTAVEARCATAAEASWLKNWVAAADRTDLRRCSVPTLDFGFTSICAPRSSLLDALDHLQPRPE